jgi:hypothetical protein
MPNDATRATAEAMPKNIPQTLIPTLTGHPRAGLHELDLLLADFLTKKVAWETSVGPEEDLETDSPEYEAAQEAVEHLIFFPCDSFAEVEKKARMIRDHWWLSEEVEQNLDEFLTSMIPSDREARA